MSTFPNHVFGSVLFVDARFDHVLQGFHTVPVLNNLQSFTYELHYSHKCLIFPHTKQLGHFFYRDSAQIQVPISKFCEVFYKLHRANGSENCFTSSRLALLFWASGCSMSMFLDYLVLYMESIIAATVPFLSLNKNFWETQPPHPCTKNSYRCFRQSYSCLCNPCVATSKKMRLPRTAPSKKMILAPNIFKALYLTTC